MNYSTLVFAIFVANLAAMAVSHLLFPAKVEFIIRQAEPDEIFEENEE